MRRRKLETEGFDSPDRVGVAEAARVGVAQPDRGQARKRQATNWHTFRGRMRGHPSVHPTYFQAFWFHAPWFMSWRDWLCKYVLDKTTPLKICRTRSVGIKTAWRIWIAAVPRDKIDRSWLKKHCGTRMSIDSFFYVKKYSGRGSHCKNGYKLSLEKMRGLLWTDH
jgi:hypothetical protein